MQGAAPTKTTSLQRTALVTRLTNDPLSRYIYVSFINIYNNYAHPIFQHF